MELLAGSKKKISPLDYKLRNQKESLCARIFCVWHQVNARVVKTRGRDKRDVCDDKSMHCCKRVFMMSKSESTKIIIKTMQHHTKRTVKASNFGPHGNFGPLFQNNFLSSKRFLQKNEENKSCRKTLDLQIWFCSLLVHDSLKKSYRTCKKKVQSFHVVQS